MEQKNDQSEFQKQITEKERFKLKARRQSKQSVWRGFGMFGLVGWSVVTPTVAFILLGMWLDKKYAGNQSYTLALLIVGLFLGCVNAWYWISKKMKEQEEEDEALNSEQNHG